MYLNNILAFAFVCCILAVNGEDIVERGDGEDCTGNDDCLNGGRCWKNHCNCPQGYIGRNCENTVSECSNNYQCPAGQLCIGGACGSTNCFNVTITTRKWGHENSWTLGTCASDDLGYKEHQVYTEECCLAAGKYTLTCDDTYKDGWHGGFIAIQGEEYCKDFFHGHEQKQDIEIISSDEPTCKCKDLTFGFGGACLDGMCYVTQPSSCPDAYPGYGTDGAGEMASRKACDCANHGDCPSTRPVCHDSGGYCTGCQDFSDKCGSGGMIGSSFYRDDKLHGCEEEYVSSKCAQTCGICTDAGAGEPCIYGSDCLSGFCNRDI